jgi:hypothetical protein
VATASPAAPHTPDRGTSSAARLAHQAALSTQSLLAHAMPQPAPWWLPIANLPAFLPVLASHDATQERRQLSDRAVSRHRATAAEFAEEGIGIYADKLAAPVPGQLPLELWEHVAAFGTGFVYAAMRTLTAALLTARAAADLPDRDVHLEALRRHWLVDWRTDGQDMWPSGPSSRPDLLTDLATTVVTACRELRTHVADGELRARLWDAMAGPGPDAGVLTRRQVAGRRIVLIDTGDPYVSDHARPVPTWSRSSGPEDAVLAGERGELQRRVELLLSERDRAVLHAYLAMDGDGTWAQAAALAVPEADAFTLGERVRRQLKRFGREEARRRFARSSGPTTGIRDGQGLR